MAHVEIIILNYNGAEFLPPCLRSLAELEKGEHTVTVSVADNASRDASETVVRSQFPWVNWYGLGRNGGFSWGNNEGVRIRRRLLKHEGRRADFYVFLNNDTVVDRRWLVEALRVFDENPRAGIVGSKSVFFDKFAVLSLSSSATFSPAAFGGTDGRTLGVFLHSLPEGENILHDPRRFKVQGLYPAEPGGRWTGAECRISVPVADPERAVCASFALHHQHPKRESVDVCVHLNGSPEILQRISLSRGVPRTVTVPIEPQRFVDVIQNAGSFVRGEWDAGDRGFGEIDTGQFDAVETVDAVCGVSMFIRSALFDRLGGFDERFFAYFEDTDLSLRARLLGFECVYCPGSRIRHVHCGSGGGEFSDYFNSTVAFSHLLFGSKVMSGRQWQRKLGELKRLARDQFSQFQRDRYIDNKPQLRAYGKYVKTLPAFCRNRFSRLLRARRIARMVEPQPSGGVV